MPSFDLISDPWLVVLNTDGTLTSSSLRALLSRSHEIVSLSEPSPLTDVALLRFLIALFSDGLRDQIPTEEDWAPFAERCRNGLPAEAVDAILTPLVGRSDVLDPEHDAFFDGPAVRRVFGWDDPRARQPISRFLPELPTGTNLAHFVHASDDDTALCVGCLLKSRAVDAAFARGGLGPSLSRSLLATVNGTEPRYVVPVGETLLQTLLLNAVVGDKSRPSWVAVHASENGKPGPIARMTWRPRLMMPLASSETALPCVRCATVDRTRFTWAVMVDTYNHTGSPFGTKADLEQWKVAGGDPHILSFEKSAITLGADASEWPLSAVARLLAGGTNSILDRLRRWSAATIGPVAITVTSSAGNQAKIDNAPHAAASVPTGLLARSPEDHVAIAAALTNLFVDKANAESRKRLIPREIPRLLSDLAVAEEPEQAVDGWLQSLDTRIPIVCDRNAESVANDWDVGKAVIKGLTRLPQQELRTLRPPGRGGANDMAARQESFETVWHRLGLPGASKRHALREALMTVAPIYAVYSERHRQRGPRSFEEQLRDSIGASDKTDKTSLKRLIDRVIHAGPASRNDLLMRLVDVIVANDPRRRSIDFVDLLLEVVRWDDPADPTPDRWRRVLQSTENINSAR